MKTAVFFYSQSGQAKSVAESISKPLKENGVVVFKEIIPVETYPFPWDTDTFFDTFPETRLGMPPSGIRPVLFDNIADADLVIIVGQSWFLSPSLPLQSFLADKDVRLYLEGRKVVFVNACRNMWLMTAKKIKSDLQEMKADFIGHIVLQDKAYNLVSVITIVRWLIKGHKEGTWLWPRAGVSEKDIRESSRFGQIIDDCMRKGDPKNIQNQLLAAKAIDYKPFIMFLERAGYRMFGLWARFIRKKGGFRSPKRRLRVKMFDIYLRIALFLLSPLGKIFFYLTWPLQNVRAHRKEDCDITNERK